MIDEKTKVLIETIKKLYRREAKTNIQKIFRRTHIADIAAILESFEPVDRVNLFNFEPSLQKRAQILSYLPKDMQLEIIKDLPREELSRLISFMDSDDAADLLGQLTEEESTRILKSIHRETSEEVADLMGYPDDSAGGLMTTDYLAMQQNLIAEEAIKQIQDENNQAKIFFYVYVVDETQKLVGVVSLKQLLLSRKNTPLKDLMNHDVVSVSISTDQQAVAATVERYDFLALPVVESSNLLVGVITVDDVIDVIREEAEEELMAAGQVGYDWDASTKDHFFVRLPWVLLSFFGGIVALGIIHFFGPLADKTTGPNSEWLIAAFIPLLLAVGGTVGSQVATVAIGVIRADRAEVLFKWRYFSKELVVALMFSLVIGFLTFLACEFLFGYVRYSSVFAVAMGLQILLAALVGRVIPSLFNRLGLDATIASVPVYIFLADIFAVVVLLSISHVFELV
jgi:magnesium transporter